MELVNILWGVIVILCTSLGFFLVIFFTGLNKSKVRQWGSIEDMVKRIIVLETNDKVRDEKCRNHHGIFQSFKDGEYKRMSTKVYFDADLLTELKGRVEKLEHKR